MRSLHVEEIRGCAVQDLEVEIVERKGKGHPDTLIDGASEAVSLALCRYYLEEFGAILHHNVDKGILVGGRAQARFGGGKILEPIYMMVAGRATVSVPHAGRNVEIPVARMARESIADFIRETMRFLDPEKHVRIETKIRPGSPDLVSVFMAKRAMPISNDTSIGVGYAPLTPTEELVLATERLMNSADFKRRHPEVGEDIKVMALRRGRTLAMTVAAAMIGPEIPNANHYVSVIDEVSAELLRLAASTGLDVSFRINAADDMKHGSYYLTVTGTSAEQGDDGNTGRGNRVNGLISPMRQYSMEATAGKNPVNHTGKILNAVALMAAREVVKEVPGVRQAYVRMLSRIGSPIDEPQIASAALVLEKGTRASSIEEDVKSVLDENLNRVRKVTNLILERKLELF